MTKQDIGFVLIKITNSPVNDAILSTIDKMSKEDPFRQYLVFNSYCESINTHNTPILHLNQSKFFFGDLVVFDIVSLLLTKNFPNIRKKYFYATDLPWTKSPETSFNEWKMLLCDPQVDIIANNQFIADAYDICWKKPIGISENFSYEEVRNLI